uniref:RWD domain-containing protein n=1 Tax=Scylla olivacea TaxID=85551 RepID=A0A0P4VWB3_SCYOL
MSILEEELKELRQCVPRVIADSTVEACVPAMVRVKIEKTKYKQITACFQFDPQYPKSRALIELKSRYISEKLLDGLTKLSEELADKNLGKPQVLHVLRFVRNFIDENPLCCCSEEISNVKKKLIEGTDELKLRQKTSSVVLKVKEGQYYLKYNLTVPENYPDQQIKIEEKECNYPPVFRRWFLAQSVEIARQCVEPPKKKKPKDPPFVLRPSMEPVVSFLIDEAHRYVNSECRMCRKKAFPDDPKAVELDEYGALHVERVYCGHIYHYKCLDTYIKTPPFQKGKMCHTCGSRIFHDKWKLTAETVEARWAHKQAKQRELDEVVDFLS